MGLAIDGNEVHGIAKGGQAFISLGNTNNKDGSLNIDGQNYLSENKMRIKGTGDFDLGIGGDSSSGTIDVTSNLSNYGGCLAICVIVQEEDSYPFISSDTVSQPIIIPTAQTTENLSFDNSNWSGSLSLTTDNKLTFAVSYAYTNDFAQSSGDFYILSNKAS
ncbi:hypothetical protein OQI87_00960 [Lactobacillus kefiranofaciens]|uniref:hypothetical protein n=1 Tax=Lactobacillus kefiranofaciens TaxID=267818 RepID=UPI0024685C74|nr:hypothetical protein [Lactobacillus kefiranofaciens]MDH5099744.1 hypothetical protein [Lactobacillus kefiranofaciens]